MAMRSIIVSIVNEIRDLILQELLKLVLKYLDPIKSTLLGILAREQMEAYTDTINDILRNCPRIWFNFNGQELETKLDTVDYADIDVSTTKGGEQPSINNC